MTPKRKLILLRKTINNMKTKKRLAKCCIISSTRKIFTKPTGLNHFLSKKKLNEKKNKNHPLSSANLRRTRKLLSSKITIKHVKYGVRGDI